MNSKNKPCVFISYSWDSEEHKDKVKEFAEKLRSSGVDIIYDGDLKLGDRIPHFMEDGIAQSDIVLFICTPNYKYKADHRDSGVGYENNIISSELYETHNERKFIPVLFEGTWSDSLPTWAKGKLGIDLSDFSRNIAEFE